MNFEYTYLPIWTGFGHGLSFTSQENTLDDPRLLYAIALGKATSLKGTTYKISIFNPDKVTVPAIDYNFWKLQLEAFYDNDLNRYFLKFTISDGFNNNKSFKESLDANGIVKSLKDLVYYASQGTFVDQSIQLNRLKNINEELQSKNRNYQRDSESKSLEIERLKNNAQKDRAAVQDLEQQIKEFTASLNEIKKITARKRNK